jgi:hypothetical protein
MTDEELRAHIERMTYADRLALVIRCEEVWNGTPWQWRAELMRAQLNAARRELN